jgi:type II secretory pathway component PulC
MVRLKSLMRNLSVMNAALLATVLLFAGYVLPPLLHVHVKFAPPSPAKSAEKEDRKTVEPQPPSPADYTVIAEQNLFNPERKIPEAKAEAAPLPKPDFVLYGTLISSDVSLAYLEDLKAPANVKRQRAMRKGEVMSGFTLKEIEPDKVLMTRGEEKLEVRITDKARSKSAATSQASRGPSVRPVPGATRRLTQEDILRRRMAIRNSTQERAQVEAGISTGPRNVVASPTLTPTLQPNTQPSQTQTETPTTSSRTFYRLRRLRDVPQDAPVQ